MLIKKKQDQEEKVPIKENQLKIASQLNKILLSCKLERKSKIFESSGERQSILTETYSTSSAFLIYLGLYTHGFRCLMFKCSLD